MMEPFPGLGILSIIWDNEKALVSATLVCYDPLTPAGLRPERGMHGSVLETGIFSLAGTFLVKHPALVAVKHIAIHPSCAELLISAQ